MSDLLRMYECDDAPADVLAAAAPHAARLGVAFASFTVFPRAALEELHAPPAAGAVLPPRVRAPRADLGELARAVADAARGPAAYADALVKIFGHLPEQPLARAADALCVAPDGEGRRLALAQGCRGAFPTAERIAFRDGGMIVALTDTPADVLHRDCVLIDDRVASGATMIALMGALSASVDSFHAFVAYATLPGLWAVSRYADGAGLDVTVNVGHVTAVLPGSELAARSSSSEWYERHMGKLPLT